MFEVSWKLTWRSCGRLCRTPFPSRGWYPTSTRRQVSLEPPKIATASYAAANRVVSHRREKKENKKQKLREVCADHFDRRSSRTELSAKARRHFVVAVTWWPVASASRGAPGVEGRSGSVTWGRPSSANRERASTFSYKSRRFWITTLFWNALKEGGGEGGSK